MADLHAICAEYVLETLLTLTEGIPLLPFDVQHMCPENGLET